MSDPNPTQTAASRRRHAIEVMAAGYMEVARGQREAGHEAPLTFDQAEEVAREKLDAAFSELPEADAKLLALANRMLIEEAEQHAIALTAEIEDGHRLRTESTRLRSILEKEVRYARVSCRYATMLRMEKALGEGSE